ncbi:MAG: prolyl oligopeptidase family serine peptidase [Clostridia bacterium]|nr:prolyl oligopeptidase family serine peptidase [Clostridia bacterium]
MSDVFVSVGTQEYRGFTVDSVYHSQANGDIHFNIYIPESYNGSKPYALYISLCGYGGYYFQGIGINLRQESFVFEAQKYNSEMIIVAPQLNDWGNTSANQTIALTEYLISAYNIDQSKVYMNGYSGGGETLSLVMAKKPELYSAVLHVSSIWDGELQPLVNSKVPVYFVIGESDEYYGSARISATYETLGRLYRAQGLSNEQINALAVLDVKPRSYFIERGASNQHGGGGLFAFDEQIMGWLFNR